MLYDLDLNRTFLKFDIDKQKISDDDNTEKYLSKYTSFNWQDLLEHDRIVILSEGGAGKTYELNRITQSLKSNGHYAFFIRIEDIYANKDNLNFAFDSDNEYQEFEEWLNSNETAYIFLDSVDEAKLKSSKDFEYSLKTLSYKLGSAKSRVKIIISSRPSAFRLQSDFDLCNRCFKPAENQRSISDNNSKDNDNTEVSTTESKTEDFTIYQLMHITKEQFKIYCEHEKINDIDEFFRQIDLKNAWIYIERPFDMKALVNYWQKDKTVGSFKDMVHKLVDRKITESDENRQRCEILTPEQKKEALQKIAICMLLSKKQSIPMINGHLPIDSLNIRGVLPNLTDTQISQLEKLPIFTPHGYEELRFDSRITKEYLAAQWLIKYINKKLSVESIQQIQDLFHTEIYDINVLINTFRPIAPWVALEYEPLQKIILDKFPEVFLEYGDPNALPLETRKELLNKICNKIANFAPLRNIGYGDDIKRFANNDLSAVILENLKKYSTNHDVREFLITLIEYGHVTEAITDLKDFVYNHIDLSDSNITAIKIIGKEQDFNDIINFLLNKDNEIDHRLLASLIKNMGKSRHDIENLIKLIAKSKDKKRGLTTGIEIYLKEYIKSLPTDDIIFFLKEIYPLLNTEPYIEHADIPLAEKYLWVMEAVLACLEQLIEQKHNFLLTDYGLSLIAKTHTACRHAGYDSIHGKFSDDTLKIIQEWQILNYKLFWQCVIERRNYKKTFFNICRHFIWNYQFFKLDNFDFNMFTSDIIEKTDINDKEMALSVCINLHQENNTQQDWLNRLQESCSQDIRLQQILKNYITPPPPTKEMLEHQQWEQKYQDKSKKREIAQERLLRKNILYLNNNIHLLNDDAMLTKGALYKCHIFLMRQMQEAGRNDKWGLENWQDLIPKYGHNVADAFKQGAIKFWRYYSPLNYDKRVPNKTPNYICMALFGLAIEAENNAEWYKKLNDSEVLLATEYAFWEINGFPHWFDAFFQYHKQTILPIFFRVIKAELENGNISVLDTIFYSYKHLYNDFAQKIYIVLHDLIGKKSEVFSLKYALSIITDSECITDEQIKILALKALQINHINEDDEILWLKTLMGVLPDDMLKIFTKKLNRLTEQEKKEFCEKFFASLFGNRLFRSSLRTNYKNAVFLKELYFIALKYVAKKDDIQHESGVCYSVGLRDNAQSGREKIYNEIAEISGQEAFKALLEIADLEEKDNKITAQFIRYKAQEKAQNDADINAWTIQEFTTFKEKLDTDLERKPIVNNDFRNANFNGNTQIAEKINNSPQTTHTPKEKKKSLWGWFIKWKIWFILGIISCICTIFGFSLKFGE